MTQAYPLRLLQNAWQQTLAGNGQVLLFADASGNRFGTLVKEFDSRLDAHCYHCRLGPDVVSLGYYPLLDVLRALFEAAQVTDCAQWLTSVGVYPPNLPIWRQLLDDHFFRKPSLRLKDFVIQQSRSLENDLLLMFEALTRQQPALISIANFHFASPSLLRLINRNRQSLRSRLLILTASDPEQLPGFNTEYSAAPLRQTDEFDEPLWLVDLPPDLPPTELDWVESLVTDDIGIPHLIQLVLENHALLCHQETLALCDYINLMLDERQIILVNDHKYDLLIVEAEAHLYSNHFNAAITSLNELLEIARQEHDDERLFDAYLRLGWCALHKHRLDDARQMTAHAKKSLQRIEEKNADWLLREREWLMIQALLHGQSHQRMPSGEQHRLSALLPLNAEDDSFYAYLTAQVNWEDSLAPVDKRYLRKALLMGLLKARQSGNRVAVVKLMQGMAVMLSNAHRNGRALTWLNLALKVGAPLQSPLLEVPLLNAMGFIHLQVDAPRIARDVLHQAMLRLQLTANYNEIVATLNNLAWAYFVGGNLNECQRLLSAAIRLCRIRGLTTLPYHTLDDLRLHQALCRFYLGNSVLAQHTLLELEHRTPELTRKGQLLHICLKLHFARADADDAAIEQLRIELRDILSGPAYLPVQITSIAAYAAGPHKLDCHPRQAGIEWMRNSNRLNTPLPALAIDVLSLLHSAELEGELEHLQQRMRDTRLLSHLSAQANTATDASELINTVCRQLSAHLDCDYVAIDLAAQAFMPPTLVFQGLPEATAMELHDKLAMQKLTRGRLLVKVRSLDLQGLDTGYVSVNRISLPQHDFGDLILMTRNPRGFEESVLRTSGMLAGQLAAAIQRLMHERELQHMSSTDMLTGLINRQALYPRLEEELARIRRRPRYVFCLAFLDLDNFKYLNDNFGHNLGDRVLRGFARLLQDHTRKEDVAARLGGDEFVILFPGQQADEVRKLALRLLESFNTPERCNAFLAQHTGKPLEISPEHCLGCSIGIVEINQQHVPKSVDRLLNLADHAMYDAKGRGKNQAIVSDQLLKKRAGRAKDE